MQEDRSEKEVGMPFATGKLGGGFRLLRAYIDEAGPKGIVPDEGVFDVIRSMASIRSTAEEVIEAVARLLINKVDPLAAVRAYRRVYGVDVDEGEAVRTVAREAAAWAIEVAESLGMIRLHGYVR